MDIDIIKMFRNALLRMEDNTDNDLIVLWRQYLDIWESWVRYVNHTNYIVAKFGWFHILLLFWLVYRSAQAEMIYCQLNKKLREINEYKERENKK